MLAFVEQNSVPGLEFEIVNIIINGNEAATGWVRGRSQQGATIDLRGVAIRVRRDRHIAVLIT